MIIVLLNITSPLPTELDAFMKREFDWSGIWWQKEVMTQTQTKPVKASSIRRAITTLVKAGFILPGSNESLEDGDVSILMKIPEALIQPKKRIRKPKV